MKVYFLLILLVPFLLIENPINVQARCIVGESFCMPQTPIILDLSNHQINNTVKVGQQIQIVGYLTNNQYTNKTFAYTVQNFLWSNLNNPSALQPPESTSIQVI